MLRGEKLANRDIGGKQDPYVVLSLKGHTNAKDKPRTAVIKKGGTDVVFTDEFNPTHELAYDNVAAGSRVVLVVEAMDADFGMRDDVIGVGEVDVSGLVGAAGGVSVEERCALVDDKRRDCGTIVLRVEALQAQQAAGVVGSVLAATAVDTANAPMCSLALCCRPRRGVDLPNCDMFGTNTGAL